VDGLAEQDMTAADFTGFRDFYNMPEDIRRNLLGSLSYCPTAMEKFAPLLGSSKHDQGLVLDAANVCRLNDHWLFLESASGNRAAYEWLCQNVPNIKIEACNFYSGVHIDSTIVPLREGLVLLNASRVNDDNCPAVFDNWEKIYVDDVVAQEFYQYPYASKWIALNMLSIDPQTVIVDRSQRSLIKLLESKKFTVIPLELRHSRTLGGGFHCVTLDIVRLP
jgi:glycine amidinotransferase/scyllo-inosamine-4-phosphate amidinotransferase 1